MRDTDLKTQETTALDALVSLVDDDLKVVNQLIIEQIQSSVRLIPQIADYVISAGGKRLRPLLTLATAKMCGYRGHLHHSLAAAVEFIHTATLLHDDVVDDSTLRRGCIPANEIFGNKASILVGDFLFSRSFLLMLDSRSLDILKVLSQTSAVIAEGEVLQLQRLTDPTTLEEEYLEIIRAKTAILFAAACRIGAMVAARPETEAVALETYGLNFGMTFQLIDDALDYIAYQNRFGKAIGNDFREGKVTLPVILALQSSNLEERNFWYRVLKCQEQNHDDFEHATYLLHHHHALTKTIEKAKKYAQYACQALEEFPESKEKTILTSIVDFIVERQF